MMEKMQTTFDETSHFFEGTEKNLKLIFHSEKKVGEIDPNLQDVPKEDYSQILEKMNCSILSEKKNKHFTAYLLSESSLFVFEKKLIIKTCGNILLLDFIGMIVDYLKNNNHNLHLSAMVYTRKKFLKPNLQPKVYQHFDNEVKLMESLVKSIDVNFVTTSKNFGCFHVFFANLEKIQKKKEHFYHVELLMNELNPERMKYYYSKKIKDAKEATQLSGIKDFIEGSVIDDYLFDPCGYSCNGLIPQTESYFTIHITPENGFSYASFETNAELTREEYSKVFEKVLATFQPKRFIINSIHQEDLIGEKSNANLLSKDDLPLKNFKILVRSFENE